MTCIALVYFPRQFSNSRISLLHVQERTWYDWQIHWDNTGCYLQRVTLNQRRKRKRKTYSSFRFLFSVFPKVKHKAEKQCSISVENWNQTRETETVFCLHLSFSPKMKNAKRKIFVLFHFLLSVWLSLLHLSFRGKRKRKKKLQSDDKVNWLIRFHYLLL